MEQQMEYFYPDGSGRETWKARQRSSARVGNKPEARVNRTLALVSMSRFSLLCSGAPSMRDVCVFTISQRGVQTS